MVERAINKFNISRKDSFLIGDKTSDIKCGEKSLLKSFLFNEKNLYKFYIKNVKNKF
jgi:histidinol phosphatase-like enzyme